MRKTLSLVFILILIISCKSLVKNSANSGFKIENHSNKTIEYVWITAEGNFYPVAKSINISNGESFEMASLDPGIYDIAIDFKGEYNSFNSKKDKKLCLVVEKGETTVWSIDSKGNIVR